MTAIDFKALGTALAYKHLVEFLERTGGLMPVEEIYGHLAVQGLLEGSLTIAQIRNQSYWKELVNGFHRVNPSVWSERQTHAYGPALPIICGEPTPRGYWALASYYGKKQERSGGFLSGLFNSLRGMEVAE
jgi:hypothetical protein